ncbi:MAG: nitroreductase family protein [Candidatus Aminicenantes bacterium]|nr:nitroreductase family protein [Candidatus Aminicenantes bacterium]
MAVTGNFNGSNETLTTIEARRSVRNFLSEKEVADGDINAILKAANHAPSAHNQQSWRFIVLHGAKKNDLAHLVSSRAADFPRPSCTLLRMACRSITEAALVIAVVNTGELIRRGPKLFAADQDEVRDFFRIMEIQSSAAAVQNMLLAATSLGIGSVWLGILILIKDVVLDFLGEPQGEFMAVVPIGYPLRDSNSPKKRPLGTFVKYLS